MKHECSKPQGSTEKDAKSNFLRNIYSEYVLTWYSQGAHEISFKLHLFETSWRFMGKWTHSNICRTVTDGPFTVQICQRCTFDPKIENPYWSAEHVKYAKIFSNYFWLIFMPLEDLGDKFLLILCLLKILASQWRPILAVFFFVSFQFGKCIVLVTFQKASFLLRSKKLLSCFIPK